MSIGRRGVLRTGGALLASGSLGLPIGADAQDGIPKLDRKRLRMTFEEPFQRFDAYDDVTKTGRWRTQFGYGGLDSFDSRCSSAGDSCYVDSKFTNGLIDPFRIEAMDGTRCLKIIADHTPAGLRDRCFNKGYVSGLITTKFSFVQQYGVFEASVRLPEGAGYFPAFWGLPVDNSWSSEFDVFESLGEAHLSHLGVKSTGPALPASVPVKIDADLTSGFHTYTLSWDAQSVVWMIDGVAYRRIDTPAGAHKPFYWLFNFAVGGKWAGPPKPATAFPASLNVAWFKAYQFT